MMVNKTSIDKIKDHFYHQIEDMAKISINGLRPTDTSLRNFQDKVNTNTDQFKAQYVLTTWAHRKHA